MASVSNVYDGSDKSALITKITDLQTITSSNQCMKLQLSDQEYYIRFTDSDANKKYSPIRPLSNIDLRKNIHINNTYTYVIIRTHDNSEHVYAYKCKDGADIGTKHSQLINYIFKQTKTRFDVLYAGEMTALGGRFSVNTCSGPFVADKGADTLVKETVVAELIDMLSSLLGQPVLFGDINFNVDDIITKQNVLCYLKHLDITIFNDLKSCKQFDEIRKSIMICRGQIRATKRKLMYNKNNMKDRKVRLKYEKAMSKFKHRLIKLQMSNLAMENNSLKVLMALTTNKETLICDLLNLV